MTHSYKSNHFLINNIYYNLTFLNSYIIHFFFILSLPQQQRMKKLESMGESKLIELIQQNFRNSTPRNSSSQSPTPKITKIINHLLRDLSSKPKSLIQLFIDSKTKKFSHMLGLNIQTIYSVVDLKFIVCSLIDIYQSNFQQINPLRQNENIQNIYNKDCAFPQLTQKPKKTNIYIDLDFSQFLGRMQGQLNQKEKLIQKLQDMMIDKDNEIENLQNQNEQLRRQIQQIACNKDNQAAIHQNEKLSVQEKMINIQNENNQLKNQISSLNNFITAAKNQDTQDIDQFLRRCLLIQAISVQNFIDSNK